MTGFTRSIKRSKPQRKAKEKQSHKISPAWHCLLLSLSAWNHQAYHEKTRFQLHISRYSFAVDLICKPSSSKNDSLENLVLSIFFRLIRSVLCSHSLVNFHRVSSMCSSATRNPTTNRDCRYYASDLFLWFAVGSSWILWLSKRWIQQMV